VTEKIVYCLALAGALFVCLLLVRLGVVVVRFVRAALERAEMALIASKQLPELWDNYREVRNKATDVEYAVRNAFDELRVLRNRVDALESKRGDKRK
jgi:hypothetical protein